MTGFVIFIVLLLGAVLLLRWVDKRSPDRQKKDFLGVKDNLGINTSPKKLVIIGLVLCALRIVFTGGIIGDLLSISGPVLLFFGIAGFFRKKS